MELRRNTPEEMKRQMELMAEAEERYREEEERKARGQKGFCGALKYIVFTPVSIAANVVAVASKIVGSVLALGMPYGLYKLYIAVTEIIDGAEISDMEYGAVVWFVVIPFIAFFIEYIMSRFADYLSYKTL